MSDLVTLNPCRNANAVQKLKNTFNFNRNQVNVMAQKMLVNFRRVDCDYPNLVRSDSRTLKGDRRRQ
jgi:hypothetical protein